MNGPRCVIIDDEERSIQALNRKIEMFVPHAQTVFSTTCVSTAQDWIEKNEFDVLLLDIQMPQVNGFDLLDRIKQPIRFAVIFVTAHQQYALQAFRYGATNYLLKPVDPDHLKIALDRAYRQFQAWKLLEIKSEERGEAQRKIPQRIAVSASDNIEFINPAHIIYCAAESNYTRLFLQDETDRVVSKTLGKFESMLSDIGFFRIHSSYLVNLNFVVEFRRKQHAVFLSNEKLLPLSKSRRETFLDLFTR